MAAVANSAGAVGTGDGGACAVDAMADMLQWCQTPHSSDTITDESGAASAPSRPARPPTRRGRGNRYDPFHYLANPRNHSLKQKAPLPSEEALMRKALNNLSNDAAAQKRIRSGACSKKDFQNLFLHGTDSAVTASSAPNRGVVAKKELNAIKASAMLGMLPWRNGETPNEDAATPQYGQDIRIVTTEPNVCWITPGGSRRWIPDLVAAREAAQANQFFQATSARPSWMEEQLHRDMMVLSHPIHGLHRQMTETKYLVMGNKIVKTPMVECFVFPCLHTHKKPLIKQMEIDGVADRDMVVQFVRKRIKDGDVTGFETIQALIVKGTPWREVHRATMTQLVVKLYEVVPADRRELHPRFRQLAADKVMPGVRGSAQSMGAIRVDDGELLDILVSDLHAVDLLNTSNVCHFIERLVSEQSISKPAAASHLKRNAHAKYRRVSARTDPTKPVKPSSMKVVERPSETVYNPRAAWQVYPCCAPKCNQMPVVCCRGTVNCPHSTKQNRKHGSDCVADGRLHMHIKAEMMEHLQDNITQHGYAIARVDADYHDFLLAHAVVVGAGAKATIEYFHNHNGLEQFFAGSTFG